MLGMRHYICKISRRDWLLLLRLLTAMRWQAAAAAGATVAVRQFQVFGASVQRAFCRCMQTVMPAAATVQFEWIVHNARMGWHYPS